MYVYTSSLAPEPLNDTIKPRVNRRTLNWVVTCPYRHFLPSKHSQWSESRVQRPTQQPDPIPAERVLSTPNAMFP